MSHRDGGWDEDPEYDIDPDIEDYERYDEAEEGGGNKRTLMLLSVVALLVVFAGVVFLAYRQGSQQGVNGAPPILRADGEPTKELPENPGGKKFPHQDAGVYDRITGEGQTGSSDGEQLLPPAEEPLAIDNPAPSPQDQQALDRMAQAIETAPIEPVEEASVEQTPSAQIQQTQTPPAAELPPAREETVSAETVAPPSGGAYVVQLAALRDETSARATFERMQSKYPDLLGGLSLDIQRADLGEKGIYYRARAGFMDKAAATTLCEQLEAQGAGCIVRER